MDPKSFLDGTSSKVNFREVSMASTSSSGKNATSSDATPKHFIRKHIIHRITPSDLKKLQEVGLDRKIAEALSKHKSQQKNKSSDDQQAISNRESSQTAINLTCPSNREISSTISKPASVQEQVSGSALNKSKFKQSSKFSIQFPNEIKPIQHKDQAPFDLSSTKFVNVQGAASGNLNKRKSQEKVKFTYEIANELKQIHHKDSSQNSIVSKPTNIQEDSSGSCFSKSRSQKKSKFSIEIEDEVIMIPHEDSSSMESNSLELDSSNVPEADSAEKITMIRCKQPPKITITAPDLLSENERQKLANLEPHQRLMHVKNLLNKKILQKKGPETNDEPNSNQTLKPIMALLSPEISKEQPAKTKHLAQDFVATTSSVFSDIPESKLPTKAKVTEITKPSNQKCFANLQTGIKGIPKACVISVKKQQQKNVLLNKPAQDLDPTDIPQIKLPTKPKVSEATQPSYQNSFTNLKEGMKGVPKACTTYVKNQQQDNFAHDLKTKESVLSYIPQIKLPTNPKVSEAKQTPKCFTNLQEGVKGTPKGCIIAIKNQQKELFAVLKEPAQDLNPTESVLSIKLPTKPKVSEATKPTNEKCFTNLKEGVQGIPKGCIMAVKNQQKELFAVLKEPLQDLAPTDSVLSDSPQIKLPTKPKVTEASTNPCHQKYLKNLQEETKGIPKACITSHNAHKNIELMQSEGVLQANSFYMRVNISKDSKNAKPQQTTQTNQTPKASIKTIQSKPSCSSKQLKQNDAKPDVAEISSINVEYPIINIPTGTLFKKPSAATNSATYYNLQQKAITSNSPNDSNSLVVLENKVLSQDEMIDLTELCLSTTSKDDTTPRFMNPHRPIPEVVIKQEKTDEYSTPDITAEGIIEQKNPTSTQKLIISNKQNKKIIISAQKLKLPPEQLAALAKKVKEKTSASAREVNKNNTPAGKKIPTKHKNDFAKTLKNKEICSDAHKKDHNYQYQEIDDTNYCIDNNNSSMAKNEPILIINSDDKSQATSLNDTTITSTISENSDSFNHTQKSAVEIVDQPSEVADCFSAIDFIVALSNTNPITEESTLELSPEELNLNASCAMNLSPIRMQSFLPLKKTQISQITSTPIIKSNKDKILLNSQQMSAIVIEKSKGSESIVGNETPAKRGEIKIKKYVKNKIINEIEAEESSSTPLSFSSPKNPGGLLVANKVPIENQESVPAITAKVGHSKLIGMPLDLELEISLEGQRREEIKKNTSSLDNKAVNISSKFQKSFEEALEHASNNKLAHYIPPRLLKTFKTSSNKKLQNVAEKNYPNQTNLVASHENLNKICLSTSEISHTNIDNSLTTENTEFSKNFKKVPESDSHAENAAPNISNPYIKEAERKADNSLRTGKTKRSNNFIHVPESDSHAENAAPNISNPYIKEVDRKADYSLTMEKTKYSNNCINVPKTDSYAEIAAPNITNPYIEEADRTADQATCNVEADPSTKDISTNSINITKFSGEIEAAKVDEMSSNAAVTSKRASRLKKGKINLVQRNKSGQQAATTPLSEDKKIVHNKSLNETFNHENKISSENKIVETHVEPNINSANVNETSTVTNPNSKPAKQFKLHNSSQQNEEVVKETQTVKTIPNKRQEHSIVGEEGNVSAQKSHEIGTKPNFSQSLPSKSVKTVPQHTVTTDGMNTSIKTGNDSQQHPKFAEKALPGSSCTEIGDITQASLETTNSFQQHINSTKKESTKTDRKLNCTETTLEEMPATNAIAKSNETKKESTKIDRKLNCTETTLEEMPDTNDIAKSKELKKESTKVDRKLNCIETTPEEMPDTNDIAKSNETKKESTKTDRKLNCTETTPEEIPATNVITKSNEPKKESTKTDCKLNCTETTPKEIPATNVIAKSKELKKESTNTDRKLNCIETTPDEIPATNVIAKSNEMKKESTKTDRKLNCTETTPKEIPATKVITKSNELQDNIEANQPESSKLQLTLKKETILENLQQSSKSILKNMRSAKISLVDIVRQLPLNQPDASPMIPFKKITNEVSEKTKEVKGISTILNQLDSASRENDKEECTLHPSEQHVEKVASDKESPINIKTPKSSAVKIEEQQVLTNKHSRQSLSRKRKRPLCISDDDLEFLPVNAEVGEIVETTEAHDRSLEMELFKTSTSSLAKKTRYSSQALETNVTIPFDALKSKGLETSKSSQDYSTTTATKQRKKLRKTTQDIEETQKPNNDTDSSEDDNRDYDSAMRDCEESNEFLGFEENSKSENFQNAQNDTKEEKTSEEKSTQSPTGKSAKRRRQDNGKDKIQTSLKKTWSLCAEETDITDDTSPADDEEEISEPTSSNKKFKDDINNVNESNKKLVKLNETMEQDFLKPQSLCAKSTKSAIDTIDSQEEKLPPNLQNVKERLPITKKSKKEIVTDTESKEKNCAITEIKEKNSEKKVSSTESDCQAENKLRSRGSEVKAENSENSGEREECRESKRIKTKDITKISEKYNNKTTEAGSDCHDVKKSIQHNAKDKEEKIMKIDKDIDKSSDCQRENESITPKSKNIREDVDENADIKCRKGKKPKHSKSLKKTKDDKGENLDITQQPKNDKQPEKSNDKNTNSGAKGKVDIVIKCESSAKKISENATERIDSAKDKTESETTPQNLPNKRKRGRPARKIIYSSEDEQPSTSTKKCNLKTSPQRNIKIEDSAGDSTSTTLNKPSKALAGRKIKYESNFNPRLLLVTKREQLDTDEILTESDLGSGSIQCGLCLKYTEPTEWSLHLTEHYGVGWKVGEDKLFIESRSLVLKTILKYMKDTSCEGLTCRMCEKVYRSGLGVLLHIETCGAGAMRVACEFCKNEYTKSSLSKHLRICDERSALENSITDESGEKKEELLGNTGRLKRNSTIKAESRLKLLGAELEQMADNLKAEKPEVDPKSRIKYVPPMEGDFNSIWLADIQKHGQASCPKSSCKFISSDLEELSAHLKNCKYMKSGYFCNFCRRVFKSEKEAIEHVLKYHQNGRNRKISGDSDCDLHTGDEQSSDDDNDLSEGVDENELTDDMGDEEHSPDDIDNNRKGSKKQKAKVSCKMSSNPATIHRKEVFGGRTANLNANVLKKWKNFVTLNYSCQPLYADFASNYSVIKQSDFNKYLPTQTISPKFSFGTKSALFPTIGVPQNNIEWSELKRYESLNNKNNTYFFLGAPIKLCCWLPLPDNVQEQYLAVVYRQDMYKFVKFTQPKQHHSFVLILKVTQNDKIIKVNVHYGFMVKDGPIHHLAFLPSGGYDEASNRLGLVAVATVTSCIKIYSLPLNVEPASTKDECSNITLIDVKPGFSLNLDILCTKEQQQQHVTLNSQCLQICWSQYCGHQHIFAGFSNGFVGIWEILNDPQQNLNCFVVDDVINYVPINYFYIGEKCVKCLAVHYDTSGPRWLAISCAHRKFIIYDIKNFMHPVIMKEDVNKNLLLSLDWCPVSETPLYTYCDTIQNSGRCVVAVSPNNIRFSQNKVDAMACGITQVHYTPLANMCVTGLVNGDIVFLDTKELHSECVLNKKFGEKRMLYMMDIKQLNGQPLLSLAKETPENDTVPSDWSMQDVNYKEKYGLIFEPLTKVRESDRKIYKSEGRCPPVNMLPLMRINTLRCNFNLNGSNLLAVGYQNGFLRLVNCDKRCIFKKY